MNYQNDFTVLAWRDAKSAALYFDHVIPANIVDLWRVDGDDPIYYKVLQSLLPPDLTISPTSDNVTGLHEFVTGYVAQYLVTFPQAIGVEQLPAGETLQQRADKNLPQLFNAFAQLITNSGIKDFSVYGEQLQPTASGASADPCLVLTELSLVDTSQLTWRHLLQFRQDEEAARRLRKLRRFIFDNYTGKPAAYIREDIEERIADYEETTRFWGFPVAKGLIEIALTSEVAAALGAALGAALFGGPLAAAAVAGVSAAVGRGLLVAGERKREMNLERSRNPIAYLVEAKKLTS